MKSDIQISRDMLISSFGCVFHIPSGTLLIADLHVGYEAGLEDEGFAMPRFQTDQMISRIEEATDRYDPSIVIINGDLKHSFDRNLGAEWRDVERIVDTISSRAKLIVLRGNHDNYLATILSRKRIELKRSIVTFDVMVSHGHETESPWDGGMILAHEHPSVRLREATGASVKIPCFLYDGDTNRLVLPAFSPMALGSDVIRTPDEERMIPLLRTTGIGNYTVFGFDQGEILNYRTVAELRALDRL